MKGNEIALRPSYWANVSGGKDSLYMLYIILHNLDKYPLDGVVHFELEIDYPFIHDVIDLMESECKRYNIPFLRFRPRKTWEELYEKFGFPTRKARWCNGNYKLDAKKQLEKFLNSRGFYSVCYIGYCVDEEKRYTNRKSANVTERYPLVEENINEGYILEWAKKQSIYNDYYKYNKRCGCMYCPMAALIENAYLLKYYPKNYEYLMQKAKETEELREKELGRQFSVWGNSKYDTVYRDNIIRTKWLAILGDMLKYEQISIDDVIGVKNENNI